MKSRYRWIIAIALVVLIGAGSVLFKPSAKAGAGDAVRTVLTVTTTMPTKVVLPRNVTASGMVAAWQEAVIGAQTGGLRVAAIHADVGTRVKTGDLLAELASDSTAAELRRLEANLASTRASLAQAKSNVERAKIAKQGGAISDQQYEQYTISEQTFQASLDAIVAQLDIQRITLAHTRVIAIDDGVITSRTALLGKVVQSGDEMFRMIRKNRLEWQAEVDASQLANVRPGQTAQITLPIGKVIAGHVRVAAPSLSTSTGRAVVYVSLPENTGAQSGMFANGRIEVGMAPALTIPQSALVLADGYSYVFELGAGDAVSRRGVKAGRRQGDRVEIVEGLAENAHIVASGGAFLADGDKVTVVAVGGKR
jgi:RND family efflux transporter MFP subunit